RAHAGAPGRGRERYLARPDADANTPGPRRREDRHDVDCVGALRLCQLAHRVRDHPERPAALVLVRARGPGPLREGAREALGAKAARLNPPYFEFSSSRSSCSFRIRVPAFWAFVSFELPGSSPAMSAVVFADTE